MSVWLYHGDCVQVMAQWPSNTIDAVVCDPPYGFEFMGKELDKLQVSNNVSGPQSEGWHDSGGKNPYAHRATPCYAGKKLGAKTEEMQAQQAWHFAWAIEALRILKPGGHLVAFGGSRTYHRLACALEDAGFELRDSLMWLYGTGFPKSLNVGKEFDKKAGSTNVQQQWEGWGTALKPAFEPIVLARKPLEGTVAANVQKWGTGALNIDGCRIATTDNLNGGAYSGGKRVPISGETRDLKGAGMYGEDGRLDPSEFVQPQGRWPANVVLDEEAGSILDAQSGVSKSTGGKGAASGLIDNPGIYGKFSGQNKGASAGGLGDSGGASRLFYTAKTSRKERDGGCGDLWWVNGKLVTKAEWEAAPKESRAQGNNHPTVKPVALMQWLVRLVMPPNGIVLDPFMGSGSTGIAVQAESGQFVGIEREEAYLQIAVRRIEQARIK